MIYICIIAITHPQSLYLIYNNMMPEGAAQGQSIINQIQTAMGVLQLLCCIVCEQFKGTKGSSKVVRELL